MEYDTIPTSYAICFIAVLSVLWRIVTLRTRSCSLPLPPGPRGLPFIGNLLDRPRSEPWGRYQDLCSKYGDLVYLRVFGRSTVILGSASLMHEYLNKHSVNTSDRKQTPLIHLTGGDLNFGHLPYGPSWKRHRKAFWQHFNPTAVKQYQPLLLTMARRLVIDVAKDTSRLQSHMQFNLCATFLKLMYGIDAKDENDEFMAVVNAALAGAPQGGVPGKSIIHYFPWMRHVPAYVPGFGFKKYFTRWQAAASALKEVPFGHVKAQAARGLMPESVVATLMGASSDLEASPVKDDEEVIKNTGAITFDAGTDTTLSTLQATLLALSMNPDVLRKVRAELDSVVGPDRMPDFADQASLPYLNAVIKETLRWRPAIPLGVPHCTTDDEEFHGYFIPKDTVLIPNVWACMHDPEAYENPEMFCPERFIRDGKLCSAARDPLDYVWGFGRRICPGRHFAESVLFINTASIVHAFDIGSSWDQRRLGPPSLLEMRASDGLLLYPERSELNIKPRSIPVFSSMSGQEHEYVMDAA